MINIFIFLSIVFFATFIVGRLIEKVKVPWIFASLLIGTVLSLYNPFKEITNSTTFRLLASLGMYFLLFIIGFEINLKEFKEKTGFIIKSTLFIILLEAIIGTVVIHYLFDTTWLISLIVSMSFATVGEAVLIPILDKFKIINTRLGQLIIGIGTFDDAIEIILLVVVGILVGSVNGSNQSHETISIIGGLILLFILTRGFISLKNKGFKFKFTQIESLFLIVLALLFLFLGIGSLAEAAPLAALMAGIAVKVFVPRERIKLIEKEIKAIAYGLFSPLFFISVGLSVNLPYLVKYPLAILLVIIASNGAKIFGSLVMGRKYLGNKESLLLGIGLSVRFSTSLVIIKVLFDNGLIGNEIYSVIIASSIVFNFAIPLIFSNLLSKWKVKK
jgi:Kef-type K+ transport system membrane component KefB